jgi:hypothetical protein
VQSFHFEYGRSSMTDDAIPKLYWKLTY